MIAVHAIIFANIAFWLVVTVYDVSGIYLGDFKNTTNQSSPVVEPNEMCFYKSSTFLIVSRMLPYIMPMHLEFFILASTGFMLLLSKSVRPDLTWYNPLNVDPNKTIRPQHTCRYTCTWKIWLMIFSSLLKIVVDLYRILQV